jgi:hypothetical protein
MRLWGSYCCSTAAKAPDMDIGGFLFLRDLQAKREQTSGLEPLT